MNDVMIFVKTMKYVVCLNVQNPSSWKLTRQRKHPEKPALESWTW